MAFKTNPVLKTRCLLHFILTLSVLSSSAAHQLESTNAFGPLAS